MLLELGCHVDASLESATDARDRIQDGTFEAALLDDDLQGSSVLPLAEALSGQGVPPFAFAGYAAGGLPSAVQSGPVIPEPFPIHELSA